MRNLFLLLLTFVSISPLGLLAQLPAIPMRLQAGKILGKSEYFVDYTYRHKTPAESKDFQEDIIRVELARRLSSPTATDSGRQTLLLLMIPINTPR